MDKQPGAELVFLTADDLMHFQVRIKPNEGMYRDATFVFSVEIPPTYPDAPPKVHSLQTVRFVLFWFGLVWFCFGFVLVLFFFFSFLVLLVWLVVHEIGCTPFIFGCLIVLFVCLVGWLVFWLVFFWLLLVVSYFGGFKMENEVVFSILSKCFQNYIEFSFITSKEVSSLLLRFHEKKKKKTTNRRFQKHLSIKRQKKRPSNFAKLLFQ